MVVFKNGTPSKNDYRKYKITTVSKPDDYEMMREVIYRHYYKVLMDDLERPDLILIDGGLGQINAAKKIIDELNINIKVVGLKKNDRHQTDSLIDGDTLKVIPVPKRSYIFYLLERIQTEVHNYTIAFHKQLRGKGALSSILDGVEGLGLKRRQILLKKYKTITKMDEASNKELEDILPKNVVISLKKIIFNYKNQ